MKDRKTLQFSKRPSDFLSLWYAFQSRKSRYIPGDIVPEIHSRRSDLKIDPAHLNSFNKICSIEPTADLHILYPFTLVYPYLMRILCRKEMPFSQFKVLNTRNRIVMSRPIKTDESLNVDCYNTTMRVVPKGIEFDFSAGLFSGTEKVWENRATYYIPGRYGDADPVYIQPKLEPLDNNPEVKDWYLPAKDRFKFGKISGDTNGIHYGYHYARMYGFDRDFAQPIRVTAQCISNLPGNAADKPADLQFFLKGPVYYENRLTLKYSTADDKNRFDLYCGENDRPCISGMLSPVSRNKK